MTCPRPIRITLTSQMSMRWWQAAALQAKSLPCALGLFSPESLAIYPMAIDQYRLGNLRLSFDAVSNTLEY
ncbi:MAG: hypothetical protein HOA81_14525 [Opitutales bacterium]|nr:hypothetical protein [Opitutales bacterium]